MKKRNKNSKKYQAIKTLLENRKKGLESIQNSTRTLKKISLTVEDHQDYLMRLAALLEVCVLALDGQGSFSSKSLSHISNNSSIGLVLEMVIDLLPYDQMHCMDLITKIVQSEN